MKTELILLSATLALAGCAHNRGTTESSPEAAYGSGSSTTTDTGSLATQPDASSGQDASNNNLNEPATQPRDEPIPAPGLEAAQPAEPAPDQPADVDQDNSNLPDEDAGALQPDQDEDNPGAVDQDDSNQPDEDAGAIQPDQDEDNPGPADQDDAESQGQTPDVFQSGPGFTGPTKPERA